MKQGRNAVVISEMRKVRFEMLNDFVKGIRLLWNKTGKKLDYFYCKMQHSFKSLFAALSCDYVSETSHIYSNYTLYLDQLYIYRKIGNIIQRVSFYLLFPHSFPYCYHVTFAWELVTVDKQILIHYYFLKSTL